MTLGRVLLVSALVHGALLLAPIPHPGSPAPPDAAPAPALVWMQIVAPPRPVAAPRPAPAAAVDVPAAPATTPAPLPSGRTNMRARAVADARVHAATMPPAPGRKEPAAIELPGRDGEDGEHAAVPAGARAIPGPAAPGSLLPGPLAQGGQSSALASALASAPAPAPALDARAYGEHIRRRIDAQKQYPARARRLGLEGVAIVIVAVDGRGHLAREPRLARSSGVAALDHEALRMARAAAPFPPPAPAGAGARPDPLVVHVPVRFSLAHAP